MNTHEINFFVNSLIDNNEDDESRNILLAEAKANSNMIRGYIFEMIQMHDTRTVLRTGRAILRHDIQETISEVIKELLARAEKTVVLASKG